MLVVGSITLVFGVSAYSSYYQEYEINYESTRAQMAQPNPPDLVPCPDDVVTALGPEVDCSLELPKFNPNPIILWSTGIGVGMVAGGAAFVAIDRIKARPKASTPDSVQS